MQVYEAAHQLLRQRLLQLQPGWKVIDSRPDQAVVSHEGWYVARIAFRTAHLELYGKDPTKPLVLEYNDPDYLERVVQQLLLLQRQLSLEVHSRGKQWRNRRTRSD